MSDYPGLFKSIGIVLLYLLSLGTMALAWAVLLWMVKILV